MKLKDEPLEFQKPDGPERTISISRDNELSGAASASEEPKSELTKSIEKMDTSLPLDKIAEKVAKDKEEAEKEKAEREKAMKEIHKTAWDTYQMERFGNIVKSPEEIKAEKEANATVSANTTGNTTVNGTTKGTSNVTVTTGEGSGKKSRRVIEAGNSTS